MKSFKMLGLLLFIVSCVQAPLNNKTYKLTILHTNDHHGRFWENKDGEYGLAARATLIAELRNEIQKNGGEVLLLDAGDVNTGVPHSDLLDAEPDFKAMAAIGYDVMAVGNHEFDNSLETIYKQQKEWAKFPFISANIYNQKQERLFPSHITKDLDGLKVTIFGLTTEDTPIKSKAENSKGITFVPAVQEAKKLVPLLRKESDVLIALTHMGHYQDGKHGSDAPGDVTLAREVNGIDLIVGGHTQLPLFKPDIQNGTIIVQAQDWGKYVGRVDLEITNGKVELIKYELIPVNLKNSATKILPDENILDLLRPYKALGDESLLIKIGSSDIDFIGARNIIRSQETNLGNLIAFSYRDQFQADLGLLNSGGIRDSLFAGDITLETVLTILPFAGEIVTTQMTGEKLLEYLEAVIRIGNPGSGSFPQMSGVEIKVEKASGKITELKIQGKKVEASKQYKIALPEFIAGGGDNYPAVNFKKYGLSDADIFKEKILKLKHLGQNDFAPTGYLVYE